MKWGKDITIRRAFVGRSTLAPPLAETFILGILAIYFGRRQHSTEVTSAQRSSSSIANGIKKRDLVASS